MRHKMPARLSWTIVCQHVMTATSTLLFTFVVAYFTGAAEWVRRGEVTTMIANHNTQTEDNTNRELSFIRDQIVEMKASQKEIGQSINNLQQQVARLGVQVEQRTVRDQQTTGKTDG